MLFWGGTLAAKRRTQNEIITLSIYSSPSHNGEKQLTHSASNKTEPIKNMSLSSTRLECSPIASTEELIC